MFKYPKNNFRNWIRLILCTFVLSGIILYRAPNDVNLELANLEWGFDIFHIFGCDRLGRDNWAMISYGSLATLFICIPARIFTLVFASFFSYFAYIHKRKFILISDVIASVFLSLPSLLVALVVISLFPNSKSTIIMSIVIADWAFSYETLQGKLREIQKSGYVSASQSLGASSFHIFYFHMIPALKQVYEFLFLTGIPSVIMTIALFSYLGIDTNILNFGPGLGEQISFSKDYFNQTPVSVLLPILGIIALVYSFGRDEK